MGQRVVHFSDLSRKELDDGQKPANVIIQYSDRRRGIHVLEVTDEEAEDLAGKGRRLQSKDELAQILG